MIEHKPIPVLKVIQAKCVDCCGGEKMEVKLCTAKGCPLWPYRMGKNPFRTPRKAPPGASERMLEINKRRGQVVSEDVSEVGDV